MVRQGRPAGLPDTITTTTRLSIGRSLFPEGRRGAHDAKAGVFCLHGEHFNLLEFSAGERQLFGLEVFSHMLLTRGSGQRQHANLHGEAEDDLGGSGAVPPGDFLNYWVSKNLSIGG
jgi:hypothetical protein